MALRGEDNGTPLQYSCLANPLDRGAWWAAVHGVARSQTRLSDFAFTFHSHALEKEMATHSSILAWRIPDVAESGGLLSMGSHRVVHNWSDLAAAAWLYCEMTWHKLDHMISLLKWWQMRYSERASHWNTRKTFFNALGFTIEETNKAILDTI